MVSDALHDRHFASGSMAPTAVDPRLLPLESDVSTELLHKLGQLAHAVGWLGAQAGTALDVADSEPASSPTAMWRYFVVEIPATYIAITSGTCAWDLHAPRERARAC